MFSCQKLGILYLPTSIITQKFSHFKDALGAMDGVHINCCPSAAEHEGSQNRKGGLSQNCLACCSFDLCFLYMVSGWEGSAADGALFLSSRFNDLAIPAGKFYLADAGFGACDVLLVPYCGVQYHLAEWGHANLQSVLSPIAVSLITYNIFPRPANQEELFNLHHAQGHNVIEQIFGVIKQHWEILNHPPQFIQAWLPPACAALHNFIITHNPNDIEDLLIAHGGGEAGDDNNTGTLAETHVSRHEKQRAKTLWDQIAQAMWDSY
jgi:hypothetical protein